MIDGEAPRGGAPLSGAERARRYRERNLEKCRERDRQRRAEWRKSNPGLNNINRRLWVLRHYEEALQYNREYGRRMYAENEDTRIKSRNRVRDRRARKKQARGTCTAEQAVARVEYYGGLCAYCRRQPHEHLDHVIPLSRGGTNWPANLRPSCSTCNLSKGTKLLSEWSGAHGVLRTS